MLVKDFIAMVKDRCPSETAHIIFQGNDYQYPAAFSPTDNTNWASGIEKGEPYSYFIVQITDDTVSDEAQKYTNYKSE